MAIDLTKLTPAQQSAVRTGDMSALSQSEKDGLISLFKADGYSVTSNGKDSIFSKKDVTQSSQAFYKDQNSLIPDMIALGQKGAQKYAETGDRKAADRLFYQSETARLQTAVAPDVTKSVVDTKPVYDNNQDPTSFHNQDDCTLGVLKQNESEIMKYLENSRNTDLKALAKSAKEGNLASTYALIGIVDSWQPDMEQNAKDGKLTADTANNVGGQPLKTDKTWVVPAEFCTEEDFKLIERKNQSDTPPPGELPPGEEKKPTEDNPKGGVKAEGNDKGGSEVIHVGETIDGSYGFASGAFIKVPKDSVLAKLAKRTEDGSINHGAKLVIPEVSSYSLRDADSRRSGGNGDDYVSFGELQSYVVKQKAGGNPNFVNVDTDHLFSESEQALIDKYGIDNVGLNMNLLGQGEYGTVARGSDFDHPEEIFKAPTGAMKMNAGYYNLGIPTGIDSDGEMHYRDGVALALTPSQNPDTDEKRKYGAAFYSLIPKK